MTPAALGQPMVVNDTAGNPRVPDAWCERFGSRTILVVPLLVADEPIGALLADDVDTTHMFSPRRIRILSGIANQAAIAIENARLQVAGGRTRPPGPGAGAGPGHPAQPAAAGCAGCARLPDRLPVAFGARGRRGLFRLHPAGYLPGWGLVIADVSDKGIPAALYMMFARTLLRAVAFSGREPAAALARANELILADSMSDTFVTAYYSVLEVGGHALTYASAGHNLALYAPAGGGPAEPMITGGIALGIIPDAEFEQKTLELSPGDVVLFYTDGAPDTLNAAGEEFGEERLAEVLRAHRHEPAEAIADAIDTAVRAFAGEAAQYDDLTLIVVKRE